MIRVMFHGTFVSVEGVLKEGDDTTDQVRPRALHAGSSLAEQTGS